MAMIPLIGFAPDLDPTTPGVMVDCKNMYPTVRGFRAMRDFNPGADPYKTCGELTKSAWHRKAGTDVINSYEFLFFGGATKIQKLYAGDLSDVSRPGGYANGLEPWAFDVMGEVVLAVSQLVPLQALTSTFTNVAGAPRARTIAVNSGFVMLGCTTGIPPYDNGDRWWCSGYQDYTDWTPNVTTQCTTGRLVNTPGNINAIVKFRDGFVAYKKDSLYLGEYVGAPDVFRWRLISDKYGASNQRSVISLEDRHVFASENGIMVFDGISVSEVCPNISKWWRSTVLSHQREHYYAPILHHIANDKVIYIYYPHDPDDHYSTYHDRVIAYNYVTGAVGAGYFPSANITSIVSDGVSEYVVSGPSGDIRKISGSNLGYFPSSFTTWSMGDDFQRSLLSEVKLRANQASPSSVTMTNYYRDVPESFTDGGATTNWNTDATTSISDSHRFFRLKSARWHKLKFDITGETEISAIGPVLVPDGTE